MNQEKRDNQSYTENFTRIPNILFVSYKNLTKDEKWLYAHLRSIFWDGTTKYHSLGAIADETGFSKGALSKMLPRLHAVGLIHGEIKRKKTLRGEEFGNPVYHITIPDLWELNKHYFSLPTEKRADPSDILSDAQKPVHEMNKPVHEMNKVVSNGEQGRSQDEQENASQSSAEAGLSASKDTNKYINKDNKEITHLNVPIGNLSTDVSSLSSSENESPKEERTPISINSKRGRPKKEYTPGEVEVLNEWDRVSGGIPEDRNDRGVRECIVYLAMLIEERHATLADIDLVYKKLNEGYWKGKVTLKRLKEYFKTTLVGIKTTQSAEDTIPDWMREAMV